MKWLWPNLRYSLPGGIEENHNKPAGVASLWAEVLPEHLNFKQQCYLFRCNVQLILFYGPKDHR
jgi:hypothetical protein